MMLGVNNYYKLTEPVFLRKLYLGIFDQKGPNMVQKEGLS